MKNESLFTLFFRLAGEKRKPIIIRDAYGASLVYPPLAGKPVGPLNFAVSLRERRDLVARHPDRNPHHKRSELKPWLSAVGAKPFISYFPEWLRSNKSQRQTRLLFDPFFHTQFQT